VTTLDYALSYIERGWSIFPLLPRSKQPVVKIAKHLSGETKWEAIEATNHWSAFPDHGIAIVTGKPSNLVVIDVDPRNGGDATAVERTVAFTREVDTGGGGRHFYCAYPEGQVVRCGKTSMPGVDRKADGGYVVAPPSIHPSGAAYTTRGDIPHDQPLAPLPEWVTSAIPSEPATLGQDSEPWVATTLAHPERVAPGTQEDVLTRLCWWAAHKLDRDVALAILTSWAAKLPLGNPHDPWTEQHVEDRFDRAIEKKAPPAVEGTFVDDTKTAPFDALLAKVRTAAAFNAECTERDDWIIKDFVAPGAYTEVIGVMKEGKSTLVAAMLKALLEGDVFLERETRKTAILYITEQVGISFKATLQRAGLEDRDDLHILTIADLHGMKWSDAGDAIVQIAEKLGVGVIVVDTLARLAGIIEEDEAGSVVCLDPFIKARGKGMACVFVRHGRKSGGAINVAARGSGAITGEMDICVRISAPEGVTGSNYRFVEIVSRFTEAQELHLEYMAGGFEITDDPKVKKREDRLAPIVQALSDSPLKPLTQPELVEITKIPRTSMQRFCKQLVDDGRITGNAKEGYRLVVEANLQEAA
jgi:hypothetical protein